MTVQDASLNQILSVIVFLVKNILMARAGFEPATSSLRAKCHKFKTTTKPYHP